MAHSHQLRVVERTGIKQIVSFVLAKGGLPGAQQHIAQFSQAVALCKHDRAHGLVHLAVAHLVKCQVNAQRAAIQHPVGKRFFCGGQQQLVAPHARNDAAQRRSIGCRVACHDAEKRSIFAHLKQVQVLPMRRAL